MDFSQLLDQLPRSTFNDWIIAAEKQLKGKLLTSINVEISDKETFHPFAIEGEGQRFGNTSIWKILGAVSQHSSTDFIQQLAWGAQGGYFSSQALERISIDSKVRFDYLDCFFSRSSRDVIDMLSQSVSESQRDEAGIYIETKPREAAKDLLTAMEVFPQGGVFLPALTVTAEDQLRELTQKIKETISETSTAEEAERLLANLVVEVNLRPSYIYNLLILRSLRLISANLCLSFGMSEPVPALRILGRIEPIAGQTSEQYLVDAATQAVAAVSSSIDYLTVYPFDASDPNEVRRSLNLQHVLAIESQFELAMDPVQGSAFIETASAALAREVWNEMS